jgi:glycosyltransferase involved in cell wall biosynthesis
VKLVNEQIVLVFLCYKQAKYLRDTLPSAFQQTVYPSEVLVMDDASPDESDEIIRELLSELDPQLNVVYQRNETNVGLMTQLNSLAHRYEDKLVVVQAGDDLSKPNRLERIYTEWVESGRPSLVLSNFDEIDDDGRIVRAFDSTVEREQKPYTFDRLLRRRAGVFGCTAAFDSQMLKAFDPIPTNVINEDRVYSFRALLKNGIRYIHEPLIDYRVGVGISARTEESYLEYLTREAKRELIDLSVNRKDAIQEERLDLVRKIDKRIRTVKWVAALESQPTLLNSWRHVFRGVSIIDIMKFIKKIKKRMR